MVKTKCDYFATLEHPTSSKGGALDSALGGIAAKSQN